MSREPSSFSVAFLLSTKVSSGMALGFRIRYLGDEAEAAMDRQGTGHWPRKARSSSKRIVTA